MKVLFSILFLIAILTATGCDEKETVLIKHVPTDGNVESVVYNFDTSCPIRHTVEIYPKEIYYGDTVYVITTDENISKDSVKSYVDFSSEPIYQSWFGQAEIFNMKHIEKYIWQPEFQSGVFSKHILPKRDLQAREKRLQAKHYFEFPPLEDMEIAFWKEIDNNIPPEGGKYNFRFLSGVELQGKMKQVETTQEILIKPRPAAEKVLLDKWYSNTPEMLFPKEEMGCKIPQQMSLHSSGKSDIRIGGTKYDPWLFVRIGNRKPSDPNNPTTLDGWRKLEAILTPSTLRDEVRLVRLQLEFYCAKPGQESDNALQKLVTWLESLPTPQQTVMVSFLKSKLKKFRSTPLKNKNGLLIGTINKMSNSQAKSSIELNR